MTMVAELGHEFGWVRFHVGAASLAGGFKFSDLPSEAFRDGHGAIQEMVLTLKVRYPLKLAELAENLIGRMSSRFSDHVRKAARATIWLSLQLTKRRPPLALLSNSSSLTLNDRFSPEWDGVEVRTAYRP